MYVNRLGNRVRSDCSCSSVISCACILLVENNPASLVQNASLLQEKLYNVTTAGSAAMALKLFEAGKGFYDIVMADFNMQDMHVFEFVRRIEDQCLSFMPVILMTKDYNMVLGKEALKNGAYFFIEKPLVPSLIERLWQQVLCMRGRIPRTSCHLQEFRGGKSLPSNLLTTPPTTNYVDFTLEGVQQNIQKLHPIDALNGTTGNGIMMNTGSRQVAGENEGVRVLMGGPQVTMTNGHPMTGALNFSNQEISGNLGREICSDENVAINTPSCQVTREISGAQIFKEGSEVTHTTGFVTREASGYLARGVYGNGNFMRSTGQVGGETGGGPMFMEGVTPTNVCVSSALKVPNQEIVVDFSRGIYCNRNGIIMSTGTPQVARRDGGVQICMGAGQVTSANGYVTDAHHASNQQPLGDLTNGIYHTANVITNTGSGQVGGEIGGRPMFMEGDQVSPINGCLTSALQVPNGVHVGWEIGEGQILMEGDHQNTGQSTGSCQVAAELARAQILMEGDYQNTGQGTATGPNDIAEYEYQLTAEDIAELVRQLNEENTNITDKASPTN